MSPVEPVVNPIGEISVKIGGKSIKLKELAKGEIVSFDGVTLISDRPEGGREIQTIYDENFEEVIDVNGDGKKKVKIYPSRSMAQQQFKDECDVNSIMRKYQTSGLLPLQTSTPIYGDFTSGADFVENERRIAELKTYFELLPSNVRAEFDNRADKMIDFALDPANEERCIELGILPKKQVVEQGASADEPASEPEAPKDAGNDSAAPAA